MRLPVADHSLKYKQRTQGEGVAVVIRVTDKTRLVKKIADEAQILNDAYAEQGTLKFVLMEDWPEWEPKHNHYPDALDKIKTIATINE